jgi:hypothetical protein
VEGLGWERKVEAAQLLDSFLDDLLMEVPVENELLEYMDGRVATSWKGIELLSIREL